LSALHLGGKRLGEVRDLGLVILESLLGGSSLLSLLGLDLVLLGG